MRILTVSALCILLTGICLGVVTRETIKYPTPLKRISGSVIGYGNVNPSVKVGVFDKPAVWAGDSLIDVVFLTVARMQSQQSRFV